MALKAAYDLAPAYLIQLQPHCPLAALQICQRDSLPHCFALEFCSYSLPKQPHGLLAPLLLFRFLFKYYLSWWPYLKYKLLYHYLSPSLLYHYLTMCNIVFLSVLPHWSTNSNEDRILSCSHWISSQYTQLNENRIVRQNWFPIHWTKILATSV